MSGVEEGAALAAVAGGTAAGTTAATAAPAAAGLMGSLGGTALGSSTSLGTGLLSGSTGVGLTAPASALGAGTSLGTGTAAVVPGMEGALGTGLTGTASAAPTAGAQFAGAATPSTFTTPYTVSDAVASLNNGYQNYKKVDTGAKAMSPQQQARQAAPQARPIFQGERAPISPFGDSALARMLMEKRMRGLNNGLLG